MLRNFFLFFFFFFSSIDELLMTDYDDLYLNDFNIWWAILILSWIIYCSTRTNFLLCRKRKKEKKRNPNFQSRDLHALKWDRFLILTWPVFKFKLSTVPPFSYSFNTVILFIVILCIQIGKILSCNTNLCDFYVYNII